MGSDASSRTQHAHPNDDHWYLVALGVRPGAQRTGLETELPAPVLQRAGQDKASCYLDTSGRCNVASTSGLGFRTVADDLALLPGGPAHVAMRREAA